MKKTIIIILSAVIFSTVSLSPATAGSRNDHLVEGLIIGTGAAILGATLIHEFHRDTKKRRPAHAYVVPVPSRHWKQGPHQKWKARNRFNTGGMWHWKKVWVAPRYEKRWKPGHHNRRGRWVPGTHKFIMIQKGYWDKKRVRSRSDR